MECPFNSLSVADYVPEIDVLDRTPRTENVLVACLPVGVIGLDGEAGVEFEIQAGLVPEVDADAVIAKLGGEFHVFDEFVFGLGKLKDLPQPTAEFLAALWAAGSSLGGAATSINLSQVDGAFSFGDSHALLTSSKRCVVRAMSMFSASACARWLTS